MKHVKQGFSVKALARHVGGLREAGQRPTFFMLHIKLKGMMYAAIW